MEQTPLDYDCIQQSSSESPRPGRTHVVTENKQLYISHRLVARFLRIVMGKYVFDACL